MQKIFKTTKINHVDVNDEQNDRFDNSVVAFQNKTIDVFEFSLNILSIENFEFDVFDHLSSNNNCKTIADHIHTALSLNQLQRFVVEKILNHVIKFTEKFCEKRNNQLLLYVKKQNDVEKNRIIKILPMKFACFKR